jgi:dTDP-4-dehydrorhamnose 3,5-epimerase-like enzyme
MRSDIEKVKLLKLPHFMEDNGDLIVMENKTNIPFEILRIFVVRAPKDAIRGQHAHLKCTQFLTCPSGAVSVHCDDGINQKSFMLDHPYMGLLIPPGIWAQQNYLKDNSILTVLCDRVYEPVDYFREYNLFLEYKNSLL